MSSLSFVPNQIWEKAAPYVVPPVAASAAIIPVFYGFMLKSAKQLGETPQKFSGSVITAGFKAAPTIGMIVGTQMVAQNRIEGLVMKNLGYQDPKSFAPMFISAIMVGLISAPSLAIFNGQTMGRTPIQSLKLLESRQVFAIVIRETSFLLAIRISGPANEAMKSITGDNQATKYGSAFLSGAIGSMIGHPADTALTLWQKNRGISRSLLMKGAFTKAVTVGGFSIVYNAISAVLSPK